MVRVPRGGDDRWIGYRLVSEDDRPLEGPWDGEPVFGDVCVPGRGTVPNLAFFSCNGVSEERHYHALDRPERLWENLLGRHRELKDDDESGFHLLVGGGDQVYADELWAREPLSVLRERGHREIAETDPAEVARKAGIGDDAGALRQTLVGQYVDLYLAHWTRPHMREAFARIPGVFTWDDHDIKDGWGSRPGQRQESSVYRMLFDAAERSFRAFQLGGDDRPHVFGGGDHHLQRLAFDEQDHAMTLLVLDVRSGRTRDRVLSDAQWDHLLEALKTDVPASGEEGAPDETSGDEAEPEGRPRHLVLVSSIPLVHLRFPMEGSPFNAFDLTDDLIDQWEHPNHRGERARLLMRLLDHGRRAGCRVTVLSGDVHVGAHGRIVSDDPDHVPRLRSEDGRPPPDTRAIIHQVTSSAIGHPPPSWLRWKGMRAVAAESDDRIADHVEAGMVDVTSSRSYIRARNWLSVRFDGPERVRDEGRSRMWCQWFREEGDPTEEVKVSPVREALVISARDREPAD